MNVFVYRNITKGCWSVKDRSTGRVIKHCQSLCLKNVTLKVSEAGRQRVLREKRKNVHAGANGEYVRPTTAMKSILSFGERIKYNPYLVKTFVLADELAPIPVKGAAWALFTAEGQVRVIGAKTDALQITSTTGVSGNSQARTRQRVREGHAQKAA